MIIIHCLKSNIQEAQWTILTTQQHKTTKTVTKSVWWKIDDITEVQLVVITFKEVCHKLGFEYSNELQQSHRKVTSEWASDAVA